MMTHDLPTFLRGWDLPKNRVLAGHQTLVSDRLYICDPLDIAKSPITVRTPTGTFPLFVWQRYWTHSPQQPQSYVNAYLALEFSANPTANWVQIEAETPGVVYETDFSAEFGSMSILDAVTRQRIVELELKLDNLFDDWLSKYTMDGDRERQHAMAEFEDGAGFVVCQSGWSNGVFGAFFGTDETGRPTQLVVDFEIV